MNTKLLRCPVLLGLLVFVAGGVRADVIAVEDFESYGSLPTNLSGLNGPGGWLGAWTTGGTSTEVVVDVSGSPLSYVAGDISLDGGNQALQITAPDGGIQVIAGRQFPAQTDTLYLSFLYRPVVQNNHFLQFGFQNAVGNPNGSVLDSSGTFRARAGTGGDVVSGIASTQGSTFLVVLRVEDTEDGPDYDTMSICVNPTSSSEGLQTFTSATASDVLDLSANAYFVIRRAFQENGDQYLVDNIRVASTFGDAVGVPEPSTVVMLLGLAGVGVLGYLRRRRRAA